MKTLEIILSTIILCLTPDIVVAQRGNIGLGNGNGDENKRSSLPDAEVWNSTAPEKPNLIMVIVDEHSFRTLGCYRELLTHDQAFIWGDDVKVDTPHLDSLARDGALFTNFYTVAPLCTPSRASFMTGLYPKDTGASKNHEPLREGVTTFADVLKESGYYTGYFGKWHLDGDEKPGWGNRKDRKFGFIETKFRYNRGHWKFFDREKGEVIGYEWKDKDKFIGRQNKHYATDFLFHRGMEFIDRQLDNDRQFAMVMSIPDPHAPNIVRMPYSDMFDHVHFKLPHTAKVAVRADPSVPNWQYMDEDIVPDAEEYLAAYEDSDFWQNHLQKYFAMVKCLDDNMGRLFDYLKEKGLHDNTVLVYTSDHGDQLGEHGKLNKGKPYEASAGIPFLVRYPNKVKGGKVIETPYSSIDFAPTILNLMGVDVENSAMKSYGIDGSNELLEEVESNPRQIRFLYDAGKKARWAAAVTDTHKLIISRNDVPWLFDLQNDPDEIYNQYGKPESAEIQKELGEALYNEIRKHKLPIFHNQLIFWDPPICLDSNDIIPTKEKGLCTKMEDKEIKRRCKYPEVYKHCPVTCGKCCEDSPGKLIVQKDLKGCEDLENQCNSPKVRIFCPRTCNLC